MATEASIVRDNAFIERYQICSSTGRFWTRKMLIDGTMRKFSFSRVEVASVIDEDNFMRGRAAMIPARVIDDVAAALFLRRAIFAKVTGV